MTLQLERDASCHACFKGGAVSLTVIGQQISAITADYAIAEICYPVKASEDLVVQSIIVTGHNADRAS
ncbi:MAG: hypothetical protein PUP92_20445 [Rhizonema sp. PD38]|nr:hypothetical protein [Rhizonema sp. PD38]